MAVMLQKQEVIYSRLTDIAMWVQDETITCESVERVALQARNSARRFLVQLWMKNRGWASSAPSISS